MMILNPTGGIFGGDRLRTEVVLGAGTHVALTTPSASKVYRASGDASQCETEISVGEDAVIEYLPDHLIPHPGAVLRQTLSVKMAPNSCAIVYDAVAAGRVGRDERWRFREITSEISIDFGDAPGFLARSSLIPASHPLDGPGLMDGFDYIGSIVATRRGLATVGEVNEVDGAISSMPGVWGGASRLATDGWVAKFLAPNADTLTRAMLSGWSIARRQLIGLPAFDFRKP
jgi:urease accessory protein